MSCKKLKELNKSTLLYEGEEVLRFTGRYKLATPITMSHAVPYVRTINYHPDKTKIVYYEVEIGCIETEYVYDHTATDTAWFGHPDRKFYTRTEVQKNTKLVWLPEEAFEEIYTCEI